MKTRKVLSFLLALIMVFGTMTVLLTQVAAEEPGAESTELAITGFETVADPKSYNKASDSAKNESKYFKSIGFRGDFPASAAIDGNWNANAIGNTANGYNNAVYVDNDGVVQVDMIDIAVIQAMESNAPITYEKGQYLAFYKLSVANAASLGSVTVWSDGSREGKGNINNAMDFYASEDGEHWVLVGSYTDICGDDSNPGANGLALLTEEKTLRNNEDTEDWISYGLKVSYANVEIVPNYVGIAVVQGRRTNNADVIFTEITVEEKAVLAITGFETVADPKSYNKASSSAKNASKYFASMGFRSSNPASTAIDGNWNTAAVGNTASGYNNAVYVDENGIVQVDMIPIETVQAMEDNAPITYEKGQYLAFYKLSVANAASLGSVTVWTDGSREDKGAVNNSMDFYASEDDEHWVFVGSYTDLCGDGSNPGANGLAYLTEEKTLRNSADTEDWTSYGLKVSYANVEIVPNYVGIAVAQARRTDNADVIFCEITVEEKAGSEPEGPDLDKLYERLYEYETPATPVANGLAIKSIAMAYTSAPFGAGAAQEEQKKIADGSLDDVIAWRSAQNLDEMTPAMSVVNGEMKKFDGTADGNDYLDYIKMELVETGDVGTIKWYIGGRTTTFATKFDVYVSADGEAWTLAKTVENTASDFVKDNEGNYCAATDVSATGVKYVMIAISAGKAGEDNLQYNVQEIQLMNTSYVFADDEAFKKGEEQTGPLPPVTTESQEGESSTAVPTDTDGATDPATEPDKKGCASVLGIGSAMILVCVLSCGAIVRKKED